MYARHASQRATSAAAGNHAQRTLPQPRAAGRGGRTAQPNGSPASSFMCARKAAPPTAAHVAAAAALAAPAPDDAPSPRRRARARVCHARACEDTPARSPRPAEAARDRRWAQTGMHHEVQVFIRVDVRVVCGALARARARAREAAEGGAGHSEGAGPTRGTRRWGRRW